MNKCLIYLKRSLLLLRYYTFHRVTFPRFTWSKLEDAPKSIGYLVIDKITSLLGPLLTPLSSQGHILMTEVVHHLRAIAKVHSITVLVRCCLLLVIIQDPSSGVQVVNDPTNKSLLHSPKSPALGPTFTFLTDATVWVSMDLRQQSSHNLQDDCTLHRAEVLKANFMVSLLVISRYSFEYKMLELKYFRNLCFEVWFISIVTAINLKFISIWESSTAIGFFATYSCTAHIP